MKNTTKTTVTKLHVSNNKTKALLTGAVVLQLAAASTASAATTSIIGGSGMNPWGTSGSIAAQTPVTTTSVVNVNLAVPGTQSTTVGNWDISGTGASSVSISAFGVGTTLASWAAETSIDSSALHFKVDTGGTLVDTTVQIPVSMSWSATIATGVNYQANTKYDVSFDLFVASGFLSNVASLGAEVGFRFVDGDGNPVAGAIAGDNLDLIGLFSSDPSGAVSYSFTTGDTVPNSAVGLQFVASKDLSAEILGSSNDYVDISGLTLDATPVPEPSGTILLGAGALLFVLRRRV